MQVWGCLVDGFISLVHRGCHRCSAQHHLPFKCIPRVSLLSAAAGSLLADLTWDAAIAAAAPALFIALEQSHSRDALTDIKLQASETPCHCWATALWCCIAPDRYELEAGHDCILHQAAVCCSGGMHVEGGILAGLFETLLLCRWACPCCRSCDPGSCMQTYGL